jgi:hypothetical protein
VKFEKISNFRMPGWWQQLLASQRDEVRRVLGELMSARGLMPLLMKVRNGGHWTPEEKEQIIVHLRRMAHLSPYLICLLLPGSIFLLPIYAWWLDRRRLDRVKRVKPE